MSQALGFGAPVGPGKIAFALAVAASRRSAAHSHPGQGPRDRGAQRREDWHARGEGRPGDGVTGAGPRDPRDVLDRRPPAGWSGHGVSGALPPKLGSMVVAIPATRLSAFATAAAWSMQQARVTLAKRRASTPTPEWPWAARSRVRRSDAREPLVRGRFEPRTRATTRSCSVRRAPQDDVHLGDQAALNACLGCSRTRIASLKRAPARTRVMTAAPR